MSASQTPNNRNIIGTRSTLTGSAEYLTSTNGKLNVNSTATLSGDAIPITGVTTAVSVGIVDGSGNQITSFGGGSQYIDGSSTVAHPTGTIPVYDNGGTIASLSLTNRLPVSATQSGTWNIASITNALPAGTNVIGHVIVDSGSITTGGLTDTQLRATPVPISGTVTATPSGTQDDNIKQVNGVTVNVGIGAAGTGTQRVAVSSDSFPASQAVTGTFFQTTQPVSLATNTPTLQSGSTTAVTQATAASLNATVVGTGAFVTQATLAAETTKVIGVTRTADGSGNLLTSTTNALDVNLKTSGITLPVSGTVNLTTPTIVIYGQKTVAVTNTAVQLTTGTVVGAIIQALAANAGNVVIGDSSVTTGNGFQLQPGQAAGIAIDNINRLYVNGISGDGVCWVAS